MFLKSTLGFLNYIMSRKGPHASSVSAGWDRQYVPDVTRLWDNIMLQRGTYRNEELSDLLPCSVKRATTTEARGYSCPYQSPFHAKIRCRRGVVRRFRFKLIFRWEAKWSEMASVWLPIRVSMKKTDPVFNFFRIQFFVSPRQSYFVSKRNENEHFFAVLNTTISGILCRFLHMSQLAPTTPPPSTHEKQSITGKSFYQMSFVFGI